MLSRLSKTLHFLGSKLKSIFEFIEFVFVPRKKYFIVAAFLVVGISVFFIGRAALAGWIPTWADIQHWINMALYGFCWVLGVIAMKIFALVIMVCQYNTFVTSPAVVKAWVLVRDVCNMGFVVILLVIAFAQILNVQKYSIKTLLPRVLLTAVLINFSKLLCGLMIDVGQVVMMTFVNGFQATAGANLVNGLGLTDLFAISEKNANSGGAPSPTGVDNGQIMLALFISIFILIAMCFVMFFIMLLLLLRIVTLWLLVILSPAAWAFGMLPMGSGKYNEWWQKFGWNVAVGPFMAFFLWISLLVMSNPAEMIGNLNEMTAGIEAKGGTKPAVGYLDNLAQAAIGLALLMASLIAAQEAGGAMAKLASKGQAATTGALKWSAGKLTGAQAVYDRGKAVYGGFAAKQAEKKAAVMDKWAQKGTNVFAAKEKTLGAIKRPDAAIVGAAKGIRGAFKGFKESRDAGGGVFKSLAAGKKEAAKAAAAGYAAQQKKSRIGTINKVMAAKADAEIYQKRQAEAKEAMSARGISSTEDLNDLANGKIAGNEAEKKNALLMLAERGALDADTAKLGKSLMSGDKASEDAFEASMKKKQVHLAYNFDDAGERAQFEKDVKAGDIDLTKQDATAYGGTPEAQKFMAQAYASLGGKAFGAQMKKVAERSDEHKATVSQTIKDPAFASQVVVPAQNKMDAARAAQATAQAHATANPTDAAAQASLAAANADLTKMEGEWKGVAKTVANITGDLESAFARRTATGEIQTHPVGHPLAGKPVFEEAQMNDHIRGLNSKELIGMNITSNVRQQVSNSVGVNQLNQLASSNEDGAPAKLHEIIKQMAEQLKAKPTGPEADKLMAKLQAAIGKEKIKDSIGSNQSVLDAIEAAENAYTATGGAGAGGAGAGGAGAGGAGAGGAGAGGAGAGGP